ncbi:hypothetical protein EDC01DRAFT_636111 [Geopyxis carbonaria]|nr:hypothetical protein EDC01DRAFT_636111 [Geopyxis carbonaria]
MSYYRHLGVLLFLIHTSFAYETTPPAHAFDIARCSRLVSSLIDNGTVIRTGDGISTTHKLILDGFYIGEERKIPNITGNLLNEGKTYFLLLKPCQNLCGRGWARYDPQAIASGMTTWLIPILLLVGNMCLEDLGLCASILTIFHVLGDPVDSIWSLLTTLETRRRGYVWALERGYQEELACAVADVVSLVNEVGIDTHGESHPRVIRSKLEGWKGQANFGKVCIDTARDIKKVRVKEIRRGVLAIIFYLSSIIYAFISALRFSEEKPGGRIACATSYVWLILVVIVSSFAGKANTRECYPKIMRSFERALKLRLRYEPEPEDQTASQNTMPILWTSGVNTFRLHKSMFNSGTVSDRYRQPWVLLLASYLPVVFSSIMSLCISWVTPEQGLKCKTFCHLLISISWILSVMITTLTWRFTSKGTLRKRGAIFIMIKDAFITVSSILLLILGNYGVFFTCYCSAAGLGSGPLGMELDPNYKRGILLQSVYPGLALGALGGVFVMTAACMCLVGIVKVLRYHKRPKASTELNTPSVRVEYSHYTPPRVRELSGHFV